MRETRVIMGMPIEIEIVGPNVSDILEKAFAYLQGVDERFSIYKEDSEISRINRGRLALADASAEMNEVFLIGEKAKQETNGYFDIRRPDGSLDPSGIAFVETLSGFEGYVIDAQGIATMTSGFAAYTQLCPTPSV